MIVLLKMQENYILQEFSCWDSLTYRPLSPVFLIHYGFVTHWMATALNLGVKGSNIRISLYDPSFESGTGWMRSLKNENDVA